MALSDWLSLCAILFSIFTFVFVIFESRRKPSLSIYSIATDIFDAFIEVVLSNNSSTPISITDVSLTSPNNQSTFCSRFPSFITSDDNGNRIFSDELPINIPAKEAKTVVIYFWGSKNDLFSFENNASIDFTVFSSNGVKKLHIRNIDEYDTSSLHEIALRQSLRK